MPEIPPVPKGKQRQWVRCRTCGRVQYYDFIPYSLSNPIMTSACGHGAAERIDAWSERIPEEVALAELARNEAAPRPKGIPDALCKALDDYENAAFSYGDWKESGVDAPGDSSRDLDRRCNALRAEVERLIREALASKGDPDALPPILPERHLHAPDGSFVGGETTLRYPILTGEIEGRRVEVDAGIGLGVIVRVAGRSYLFRYEAMIRHADALYEADTGRKEVAGG